MTMIEREDGTREWWIDGKLHRTDGPARIWKNGTEEWWFEGMLHRLDGPAVINAGCKNGWWAWDVVYSYEEWLEVIPDAIAYKWKEFCA
jgi:predicted hydrolase (HD superfamily)